jgi:CDP-6-deoxy-D-xylo-4-hexulose-3-dehydrase
MRRNDGLAVPLASSGLRPKDIEAAVGVLSSGELTMGELVRKFENQMADYLGTETFVMTNSGSSANLLMIEAALRPAKTPPKLQVGQAVLVPAIAWPTTIWPFVQLGLTPIFVDIDPVTLALDLADAAIKISKTRIQVSAMMVIHPLGFGLGPEYQDFCREHGLLLINDVCESLGSFRGGRHAGTDGFSASFSFYFSHHLTTMEGGGVATNAIEVADDLRAMRSHGWSRDRQDSAEWGGSVSSNEAKFLFVTSGYNVRPMEIQAAIGLSQLPDLPLFLERRRRIAEYVRDALDDSVCEVIDATLGRQDSESRLNHSWMLIPIRVRDQTMDKTEVTDTLNRQGIETRPVLTGNFLSQPAVDKVLTVRPQPENFPNATRVATSSFLVSAHHDLSDSQVELLAAALRSVGR